MVIHLNETQLAKRWNLSARTLQRWRWANVGPPYLKLGGRVVYRLGDVEEWELEHRCGTAAGAPADPP
jgi:hypothetical protein